MLNKSGPFIYIHTLLGYLFFVNKVFVRLYLINVITAEPNKGFEGILVNRTFHLKLKLRLQSL